MADAYHTPSFNLKAVVQETGLKADTLRAWERRYGLPEPGRTSGGHRLYSQHDIDILNWLTARQEEGMSISRAVKLWRQLESEGRDPLRSIASSPITAVTPAATAPVTGNTLEQFRASWVNACLDFDERTARYAMSQAFAMFPVETVCFELLQKGLSEIGRGWYEGKVSVQQEHFASALAVRQLEALLVSAPEPTRNGSILIACPPQEQHTFSPLLFTLLLRRQGWHVVYLGANVPHNRLETAVERIKPHLVVLIAQTLVAAGNMLEIADYLREHKIPTAFGGAVFNHIPETVSLIPGHYLGDELEEALQATNHIMGHALELPAEIEPTPAYQAAYEQYLSKQTAIEAHVQDDLAHLNLHNAMLRTIIRQFSDNVKAALRLGKIDLMTPDVEWVQGFLANDLQKTNEIDMKQFILSYCRAVEAEVGAAGEPIKDWMTDLTRNVAA